MSAPIIGIDLGTTNSCVAILENGVAKVLTNAVGDRTTPSMLALRDDGKLVVGAVARRQAVSNPTRTLFGVKRLIGRRHDAPEVTEMTGVVPFPIVRGPNGDAWVRLGDKLLSPSEVSAHVLGDLRATAETYLGVKVTQAIITVPAYFDDAQRQATRDAGRIAGLEVRAIINEPTAAALAYGVHKEGAPSLIAVFDLGGGTFDISILRIEDGVFEVLATSGDTLLGGDDFDRVLAVALRKEAEAAHGAPITDPVALQRLVDAAERAKRELSALTSTEVQLPFLATGGTQGQGPAALSFQRTVTRAWLEELTAPLLERLEAPCMRALADCRMEADRIDHVVLVGGMTRMPAVEARAAAIFGKRPVKGVNPDEIVAIGAATQSAIMQGQMGDVVLLDVASHSIGVKVAGGRFSTIIARNSMVPARETKVFTTTSDGQDFVSIEVYQGEEPMAAKNRLLGKFILGDLPHAPAGKVKVEVQFTLDCDGIVRVEARDVASGKATSKKILASSGLSPDEVDRLAKGYVLGT